MLRYPSIDRAAPVGHGQCTPRDARYSTVAFRSPSACRMLGGGTLCLRTVLRARRRDLPSQWRYPPDDRRALHRRSCGGRGDLAGAPQQRGWPPAVAVPVARPCPGERSSCLLHELDTASLHDGVAAGMDSREFFRWRSSLHYAGNPLPYSCEKNIVMRYICCSLSCRDGPHHALPRQQLHPRPTTFPTTFFDGAISSVRLLIWGCFGVMATGPFAATRQGKRCPWGDYGAGAEFSSASDVCIIKHVCSGGLGGPEFNSGSTEERDAFPMYQGELRGLARHRYYPGGPEWNSGPA